MIEQKNTAYELITVLGPTASGKTAFAVKLAQALNTEIISADSRQIYRGMTIGTGKDLDDYIVDGQQIPYHLIDICEAGEKYNVFQYQHDFHAAFEQIKAKNKLPIVCGGTGLYIESVLKGYKFDERKEQEPSDYPPINSLILGIHVDREIRRNRISVRLKKRLDEGMVDEIRTLLQSVSSQDLMYYGLEYKYVTLHVLGKLTYEEMYDQLEIAIHQFAKRQMTWFRGMEERRGLTIHWVNPDDCVDDVLKSHFGENRGLNGCKSR